MENAEKIGLELDRNIQILQPSQAARRTELPLEFFKYTPEELKKEQQAKYSCCSYYIYSHFGLFSKYYFSGFISEPNQWKRC